MSNFILNNEIPIVTPSTQLSSSITYNGTSLTSISVLPGLTLNASFTAINVIVGTHISTIASLQSSSTTNTASIATNTAAIAALATPQIDYSNTLAAPTKLIINETAVTELDGLLDVIVQTLDARLDVLEAAPVTTTTVDTQIAANTEALVAEHWNTGIAATPTLLDVSLATGKYYAGGASIDSTLQVVTCIATKDNYIYAGKDGVMKVSAVTIGAAAPALDPAEFEQFFWMMTTDATNVTVQSDRRNAEAFTAAQLAAAVSDGTTTKYAKYSGTNTVTEALLSESASTVTTTGSHVVTAGLTVDTNTLIVDSATNKIGISATLPFPEKLSVAGNIHLKNSGSDGMLRLGNTANTNTVDLKASTTSATYSMSLPVAAPATHNQITRTMTTGAQEFIYPPTILVASESELIAAFTDMGTAGVNGTIKLTTNVTLTAHRAFDFGLGIVLDGGHNSLIVNGFVVTIAGTMATVNRLQFVGAIAFASNDSTTPDSQHFLKINDSSLTHVHFNHVVFANLIGSIASASAVYPIQVMDTADSCNMSFEHINLGTTGANTKPFDNFRIRYDYAGAQKDAFRVECLDWSVLSAPDNSATYATRLQEAKGACIIKIDLGPGATLVDNKCQFGHDSSVTLDPTSTMNSSGVNAELDDCRTMWGSTTIERTGVDPTRTNTLGNPGDICVGGAVKEHLYIKHSTLAEDMSWTKIGGMPIRPQGLAVAKTLTVRDDENAFVVFNTASACAYTLNRSTTGDIALGSQIKVCNTLAGALSITSAGGAGAPTILSTGGTSTQNGSIVISQWKTVTLTLVSAATALGASGARTYMLQSS
jgi:hypothetical protein